jgi:simple sugar transport system permease protein
MMFFLRGAVRFVSVNPETDLPDSLLFVSPEGFKTVMTGQVAGPIYAQLFWLALVAVVAYLILNRHRLGNHIYTAGGNPNAAVSIGVNVRRTKLVAFVICALTAGFAGLLQATRITEIEPSYATISGLELKAIAAAVVGGVSLYGGRGTIIGIILGAAMIDCVDNVLVLLNAPETIFKGILGAVIILAVVLNNIVSRREVS